MRPCWIVAGALFATIAFANGPAFAGKEEARDVATGISLLGPAGIEVPVPVVQAAGVGALIG